MSNTNKVIIIDEFLTFVQNKIDVLDELSITQICATNFTESDIETSKTTLFQAVPDGGRCMLRKGEDKTKKNIKDVIKLFKEVDPNLQPTFVAKNLNRLPPVSFDHVDVTRLLKDVTMLKTELLTLRSDSVSKGELAGLENKMSAEFNELRITLSSKCSMPSMLQDSTNLDNNSQTPKNQKQIKKRKLNNVKSNTDKGKPTDRTQQQESPASVHTPSYRDIILNDSQPLHTSPVHQLRAREREGRNLTKPAPPPPPRRQPPASAHSASAPNAAKAPPPPLPLSNKDDEHGYQLVVRKKRKRNSNMCGTAQSTSKMGAADMLSYVYVSRLRKDICEEDIKSYITDKGLVCLTVSKLQQTYETNFVSYKVTVLTRELDSLLNSEFWPVGVKYRMYRERARKVDTTNN
ncbi:hypothetical protein NE865_06927 [Phthorimaea operculella]|nr:hypothetical protein NE865_06927 [Phthorimaea operculella]